MLFFKTISIHFVLIGERVHIFRISGYIIVSSKIYFSIA